MFPLLLALIVFALAGAAATAWLRSQPPKENDLAQGLAYLADLRWGDFIRLVLRAMHARGYSTIGEDGKSTDGIPSDGKDILLQRGSSRTLLSCKYGNASIVSAQAILGLGKSAQLRGAEAAIVITPGRFDAEARRVAGQQHIDLIDGEHLWLEVKPFVPEQFLAEGTAKAATPIAPVLAWGGAAVLGGIVWLLASSMLAPIEPVPVATAATRTAKQGARTTPVASAVQPRVMDEAVTTDPAELDKRRREAADSISTLFGVNRAIWASQSTLLVILSSSEADPLIQLCPLLERYPELAASRIQLQPPPNSDRPVRFKQCQAY